MNKAHYSIEIQAPAQTVWDTLWQDETLRQWADIIDPGTYMVGELQVGNEVQFNSESGYGVTSLVEAMTPNKYLLLKHHSDTQDNGQQTRDEQWSGGTEEYTLDEQDGTTTLTVTFDVPTELEAEFNISYPKAMQCIKTLAEAK